MMAAGYSTGAFGGRTIHSDDKSACCGSLFSCCLPKKPTTTGTLSMTPPSMRCQALSIFCGSAVLFLTYRQWIRWRRVRWGD